MSNFTGFPTQLIQFFKGLEANNSKSWFQDHKKEYESFVKVPSQEFVSAMGGRLRNISPSINAIPKVNKSLFRINRDTRFSADKSPYKTNLGILFWDGSGKRMESPGFYFHIEGDLLMLGTGLYVFSKGALQKYRETIVDKNAADALKSVITDLMKNGYTIGTKHYKRIPRGFDATSDFEKDYLLYNGLTARIEMTLPDAFFTEEILDLAFDHFKAMSGLQQWLMKYMTP